jgi:3D (Asp-Asp-Asp) domain-containing protein
VLYPVRGFFVGKYSIYMKRTITSLAIAAFIGGLGLFGIVGQAGAGVTVPQSQQEATDTLVMRITAYASVPEETDDTPFITASGEHVRDGIVASNILPFGTKIQIPELFGNKIFVVEDRMNRRIKNTIDIWMPTKLDAVDFGVAHATVVVIANKTSSAISAATVKGKTTL